MSTDVHAEIWFVQCLFVSVSIRMNRSCKMNYSSKYLCIDCFVINIYCQQGLRKCEYTNAPEHTHTHIYIACIKVRFFVDIVSLSLSVCKCLPLPVGMCTVFQLFMGNICWVNDIRLPFKAYQHFYIISFAYFHHCCKMLEGNGRDKSATVNKTFVQKIPPVMQAVSWAVTF